MLSVGLLAAFALLASAVGAAALSTATGMGGGILLFIAILSVFPMATVIPLHGAVQSFSNGIRVFALRKYLKFDICGAFLVGAVFGVLAVYQVLQYIEGEIIPFSIVLGIVTYSLLKPARMPEIKLPPWGFAILGLATGFLAILVGAVGPFLAPFFLRDDFSPQEVVANKSFMQFVIHVAKLPVFLLLGFSFGKHALLLGMLLVGSIGGTYLGVWALSKVSRRVFLIAFKSILFVVALRIGYRLYLLVTL